MARIYVGTCSWADHKPFFPANLPANEQIAYYAARFPIVEVNASYYRMMPRRNYALWAERTPPGFVFDVKPYKQITWHDRATPPDVDNTQAFAESLQPLREAGKLGAVHCQFPPWYVYRPENVAYLAVLREQFPQDRVGIEFRHRSWLDEAHREETAAALRAQGLALTVVDEPQLGSGSVPTVLSVTDPRLVIVRFHGRNSDKWYAKVKTTAERFDYLYNEDELRAWVPGVRQLAEQAAEVHLLFNNNAQDYAIQNARQLALLLGQEVGLDVVPAEE